MSVDASNNALVAFAEAIRSDPSGSDVSRAAASQLVDALTAVPNPAAGEAPAPSEPAPTETPQA
jgi:hypothetical protein